MTNKKKVKVRDIQEQTGWKYRFTMFLIEQLGYGVVSEEVDRVVAANGNLAELGETLDKRARSVQANAGKPFAAVCPSCGAPHRSATLMPADAPCPKCAGKAPPPGRPVMANCTESDPSDD